MPWTFFQFMKGLRMHLIILIKMSEEKLIYDVVVGYMLKVIKSGAVITKFKLEFNAIKHGDYVTFISLINIGIPSDIIVLNEGNFVSTEQQLQLKNVDFLSLILAAPSLINFYSKCVQEFGEFIDDDLTNVEFEKLANFKMVLRMHFNNTFVSKNPTPLVKIINLLLTDLGLPADEINIVQRGREFLNMVKGHKPKFVNIQEGLNAFNKALNILDKYEINLKV